MNTAFDLLDCVTYRATAQGEIVLCVSGGFIGTISKQQTFIPCSSPPSPFGSQPTAPAKNVAAQPRHVSLPLESGRSPAEQLQDLEGYCLDNMLELREFDPQWSALLRIVQIAKRMAGTCSSDHTTKPDNSEDSE